MNLTQLIRTIADYPKPGIMFRDITTLLKDSHGFTHVIDAFAERYQDKKIDAIVGIEARGFIIGAALAYRLGLGFIPIRKKGKLPGATISQEYLLEYGTDVMEIHEDALTQGQRVIVCDDLLATGGTALGAAVLLTKLGAAIEEFAFVVDLPDLKGGERLRQEGHRLFTLCEFEGE